MSFAIPMDVAINVVEQIKTKGIVSRGWLGVQIQNVTRELAESFNMDRPYGALIAKVIPDSPAEQAGLQIGDVIIEFDGHEVDRSGELPPLVGITPIGEKVKVKIIRAGNKQSIKVIVDLLPTEAALASAKKPKKELNRLAIIVSDPTAEQRKRLELSKQGVLVQSVKQGPAQHVGIQQGDIILRIQNNVVRDVADFDNIVKELPAGQSVAVLIQRRGSPIFLALKINK
jgi:serine protease Do